MGKNVQGFEIGDRCVADVGITVRHLQTTKLCAQFSINSVTRVSSAGVANLCSARTSKYTVCWKMEDLPNTFSSERSDHPIM